jgi:hypothetical protein
VNTTSPAPAGDAAHATPVAPDTAAPRSPEPAGG